MSEQEVRDGLRAAVSGEPALSFDADALMTKAQHKIRGRRALIAAGVATVGVAVAAVAVPTMLGTPRGSTVGGIGGTGQPCVAPPTSPTPTTISLQDAAAGKLLLEVAGRETTLSVPTSVTAFRVATSESGEIWVYSESGDLVAKVAGPTEASQPPCPSLDRESASGTPTPTSPPPATSAPTNPDVPWPPPNVTPKRYTALELNKLGAKMQEHLRNQFGKVVPGAKSVKPGVFQGEAAGDVEDGQSYLNAFTTFTMNGARYAVDIYTSAPGADGQSPADACAESTAKACVVDKRGDGSATVVSTLTGNESGSMQIVSVTHFRPNGTVVRATGYNYDPTGSSAPTPTQSMPVTVEQLTALATDPALGL